MMSDIATWLEKIGLGQCVETFVANDIDLDVLPLLTDQDLKDLGLSLGYRRKLLAAIEPIRSKRANGTQVSGDQADATPSTARGQAERRQLTVMFVDLVGSTALSERLDPEEMRELIGAYQNTVVLEINRFEGYAAKFMGDGVLVYFGWPQAHEDDAERAVRSGLSVVEAVKRLAAPDDEALQVRVGIATGVVVVGDVIGKGSAQEQAVVGAAPHLAARLQGLAAGNTVVIAASTRALLGTRFAYEDLGSRALRGFAEPMQIWRVVRALEGESRFAATRGPRLAPLVGRRDELALLVRRWATAKQGAGQVVLLAGEAGIGKSRLAHTLHQRIRAGPHLRLLYQCSPYHRNSALYPFIRQLERAAGFDRADNDGQKLGKLEALLGPTADSRPLASALLAALLSIAGTARYPTLSLSPQQQKQETLNVLLGQLEELAGRRPVLLIFEDVHWVDPTSQALLDLIVERVPRLPVLVLITFRPDYAPPWLGEAHVSLLALNRLNPELGAAIVRALSGGKALPTEVLVQIVDQTDGIPLFVEELTKAVLAADWLKEQPERYTLADQLPAYAIPTTLQDSLMARLDQLASAKEVAQIGAVIGREFAYELLAAVAALADHELNGALERLQRAELISRRGVLPATRYLFKHTLVQEAAYESLLNSRRQQLHARVARAIEQRLPELAAVEPELLAHHYTAAGLVEPAVTYWRRAGERAVARSAHLEAIGHLKSGLNMLQDFPDGSERNRHELNLQSALGPPLIATKGYGAPEIVTVYTRARELCRKTGDNAQLCPILYGLWTHYTTRAEYEKSRNLCEDLLTAAKSVKEPASLLDAYVALSCTSIFTGEFDSACEYSKQGMALYDAQLHHTHPLQNPGVVCRTVHATAIWYLGYPEQAIRGSRETLSLARELAHPFSVVVALTWFAMLHHYCRDAPEAQALAEEAIAVSHERSFSSWFAVAAIIRGWALAEQGQQDAAWNQVRESIDHANAVGSLIWRPYQLSLLADAHRKVGQIKEAKQLLAEALAVTSSTGEQHWEAELHRQNGELLLSGSVCDPAAAETCFTRALKVARRQQAKSLELRAAISLSRLWRRQEQTAQARELLAPIYDWFTEGFDTADLQEAKTLLDKLD